MRLAGRLMRLPAIARPLAQPPAVSADAALPSPSGGGRSLVSPYRPTLVAGRPPAAAPWRPSLRTLSFVVLVLIPTAIAAIYCFLIAADQYVAEFRFTLNTAAPPRLDALSLLTGNAAQSPATLEAQVLVQYIGSRAIVDRIDASLDIRRLLARPEADWWARLPPGAPIEQLVAYWRRQVDPFYDRTDGTVTVRVRAFAPRDALRLAQAIVAACETLVNDLSLQARRDTLRHAEADLALAENRLKSVLGQLSAFRDREGLIDPTRTAAATGLLATQLRDELVNADAKLATLKVYMHDNAPTVKVLKARIRALQAQRRSLGLELTDPNATHADALSHVLGPYEQLESAQKFAEAAYQHALQGLDLARANADRQHVFVASFIPPSLPQEALYPRRWRTLGTFALVAFAIWGIGCLAVQSIRDHLA
jgi:capsular polysaccharide transport system permease protein